MPRWPVAGHFMLSLDGSASEAEELDADAGWLALVWLA